MTTSNPPYANPWTNKVIKCQDCGLKKLCFPKNLAAAEIQALEAIITRSQSYSKGDCLYHAGDLLSDLIIIKSGSAKTERVAETGAAQIVSFHLAGDLLGLDSLSKRKAVSSVTFLENSCVCVIPYPAFNALSEAAPQLQEEIISRLCEEIANSHNLMLAMNNYTADQRVAVFLQELSCRQHSRGLSKELLHLSMSRNEIASYLGLAPATVSRALSKFERDGFLQVANKHLQITDYQALVNLALACPECALAAAI